MKSQDLFEQANQGIVGINEQLEVFGGYDEAFEQAQPNVQRPEYLSAEEWDGMPKEEKVALADRMIQLWSRYREAVLAEKE